MGQTAEGIYFQNWRTGLGFWSSPAASPECRSPEEARPPEEAFPAWVEPGGAEAVNDETRSSLWLQASRFGFQGAG